MPVLPKQSREERDDYGGRGDRYLRVDGSKWVPVLPKQLGEEDDYGRVTGMLDQEASGGSRSSPNNQEKKEMTMEGRIGILEQAAPGECRSSLKNQEMTEVVMTERGVVTYVDQLVMCRGRPAHTTQHEMD